jgi:hypothetical protein
MNTKKKPYTYKYRTFSQSREPEKLGGFLKDVGKTLLNTVAMPMESITGNNFYDPDFEGHAFDQINKVAAGVVGAATDIAGTAFIPGYGYAKAGLQTFTADPSSYDTSDAAGKWGQGIAKVGSVASSFVNPAGAAGAAEGAAKGAAEGAAKKGISFVNPFAGAAKGTAKGIGDSINQNTLQSGSLFQNLGGMPLEGITAYGGPINQKAYSGPINTSGPRAVDNTVIDKDAMNAMMKARLAYANEFGNPAAKRMVAPIDNSYDFGNGETGTHFMSSMDNYAVPQIQNENGQLQLGNYGPRSNEAMRFDSDEDANYFAAENYKRISPAFQKAYGGPVYRKLGPLNPLAFGGEIDPPKKKDLFSQYYAATGQDMAHLSKVNAYLDQLAEAESFSGLSQSSKNSSAKGFYHYLDDSVKTADQRIKNIQAKNKFDPELVKLLNEQLKLPIEERSREMQSIMVLSDHMESPTAPYRDFIAGKVDGSELYYRGHHTEDPNAVSSKEKVKENWNNAGIRIKERDAKDTRKLAYGGPIDPPKRGGRPMTGTEYDRSHLSKKEIEEFQKILNKEGLYNSTIDGKWGPLTEKAYVNSKTFSRVTPSLKENVLGAVLPSNLAQAVNKETGSSRLGDNSLSLEDKRILFQTIENAKKRTGTNYGGTEYIDYSPEIQEKINKGKDGDVLNVVKNTIIDDKYRVATTVGRGRYWPDPDRPGGVIYTDVYDWNKGEKNFAGDNIYQKTRNYLRDNEKDDLNYQTNDNYRMNFRLHPDDLKEPVKDTSRFSEKGAAQDLLDSGMSPMKYGGQNTNNMRFKYAAGGELQSIDTGGSHEQNPMGGVPMGPSASVEEGETVKDNFVFSDRIKVTKDIAREFSLPKSYVGKTYAAASKIGEKHNKHNDHIDAKTNELITARLTEAQEAWKAVHMPEQNPMMAQGMHQMPDGTMMPDSEMQGQQPPEMMGQGMPQQGGMPGMPEGMDPAMMEQMMAQGAPPQMMAYGGRIGMAYGGRMPYDQGGPTSGPTSNPENKYKGVPVPDYIYNRLLQEGYTDIAAKGILANIKHESNFVVSATEKKPNIYGTRGYGIVQWTDGKTAKRRTMMENWMEENGLDKADLDAQLDYLFYEIDNIPSNMPTGTNMSKEKLNQSTSVEDSTTYFMNNFEAPNAKTARLSQRIEYAKKIDPVVLSTEELQKLQKGFLDFENLPTEFFDENAQRINAPDSGLAPYNTAGPRGQDSLPIPGYPAPDFTLDEETGSVPVQTATADPRKLIQLPAQDNFAQKEDVQDVGLQPYGNNTAPRAQDPNYGWPKVNGPDQWGDLGNILKENGVSDEDIQRILNDPTSVTEVTKILDGEYSYSGTKDRAIKSQKITEFIKGARNTQSPSSSLPIPGYASPDFTADPEKANELWRRGGMPATGRTYWDDNLHNEEEIIPGPYPVPQKNADDIMPDVNLVEEELENPSYDEVTNLLEKDRAIKEAKQAAEAAGAITENRYKGTGLEYAPVIANTIQGLSKPARLDKNDYTYQSSVTATPYNIEPQQRAARNAYATAQNAGRAASSDAGSYMSSLGNLYGAYTANNSRLYAEKENQEAQRLMAAQSAADQASQFNSQMGYRVDDWNQNSVDATRNHLMTAADQLGQIGARQSNYNMYNNLFQNQENVTQDVGQVNNVFDFLNGFGKNKEKKEGKALGGYFYKPKNS